MATAEQFKPGDVVTLKSGGPKMTASHVGQGAHGGPIRVWCNWFDGPKPMQGDFLPEQLKLSND